MFSSPYDKFLEHLLDATIDFDKSMLDDFQIQHIKLSAPRGGEWTVWISHSLRTKFLERKAEFGNLTHGEFLMVLFYMKQSSDKREDSNEVSTALKSALVKPTGGFNPTVFKPTGCFSPSLFKPTLTESIAQPAKKVPPWLAEILS
jgi:hypothetical protein